MYARHCEIKRILGGKSARRYACLSAKGFEKGPSDIRLVRASRKSVEQNEDRLAAFEVVGV
eukprot:822718-Rhodomonas_salina.2